MNRKKYLISFVSRMSIIDVSDLNLHLLILALWNGSKPAAFFQSSDAKNNGVQAPCRITSQEIDDLIKTNDGTIEYIGGRAIKTNFSDMTQVDTFCYDSQAGKGAFEKVVASLRG